jgi:hypothetical protein
MASTYINNGFPDMIQRARRAESLTHAGRKFGVDCILFSSLAIEAFINDYISILELFESPKSMHKNEKLIAAAQFLKEAEANKMQPKSKLQSLHYLLTNKAADLGSKQFQDLSFIFKLRNTIVHHKTDSFNANNANIESREIHIQKIIKKLAERRILTRTINILPADWKSLLDESPAISSWAINTVRETTTWVYEATPEGTLTSQILDGLINSPHSSFNSEIYY